VAEYFHEAIQRTREEEHVVDRFILNRLTNQAQVVAGPFARIYHEQLTLYVVYALLGLPVGFIIVGALGIAVRFG
jgi:hypothetical protein